jgi:hypothetical protein
LQPHPNVSLNRLHHMTKMNSAVGVRERAGYEDFASTHEISLF